MFSGVRRVSVRPVFPRSGIWRPLSAPRHRRQDLHDLRRAQIGILFEEARVLAVHEDGDEAAERSVAEHTRAKLGVTRCDLALERRQVSGLELNGPLAANGGAQRRGRTSRDAHASASSYARRNASASASMTGPRARSSGPPL